MASVAAEEAPLVSVVIPCYNAATWLEECLLSVRAQLYRPLEVSLWDDSSSDCSVAIFEALHTTLREAGVSVILAGGRGGVPPLGCGAAKNRAVAQSAGKFLCFQDADDVMQPERVQAQLELLLQKGPGCLVGSGVVRDPEDAQPRHTAWLNGMTEEQLMLQRFCESTVAMPTWFCAREVFDKVGPFSEAGPGTPEDLDFFYRHLQAGGSLAKVPERLVVYRFHAHQQSRGVSADSIWSLRVAALEAGLLVSLPRFSIWSAGRDGKRLYRSLSACSRQKVVAFLDVDVKKLAAGHYYSKEDKVHVPIVPWTRATEADYQPTLICVKRGLHAGFEENLASLNLVEGEHYWHFT